MRKDLWVSPPLYGGKRNNKKILREYSAMVALLAISADKKPAKQRLTILKQKIDFRRAKSNGADISGFVDTVYYDIIAVRDLGMYGSNAEYNAAIHLLESDIDKMLACIKDKLVSTPFADNVDRRVIKFTIKVENLKAMYKRTYQDYTRVKLAHDGVMKDLGAHTDSHMKQQLESRERRMHTYCELRESALDTLAEIIGELEMLVDTAKVSPSLAGRINRLINVKRLGDFYANPIRAQKQREKLKSELLYIIQSVTKSKQYGDDWAAVMYSGTAVSKPVTTSPSVTSQANTNTTIQPSVTEVGDGVSIKNKSTLGGF